MSRRLRCFEPGSTYHVFQRGNNRIAVFIDDEDRLRFLDCVRDAAVRYRLAVHGFALMSNHYHLVTTLSDRESLSLTIKHFSGRYVRFFNRKHGRIGGLWSERFGARAIRSDRQFLACLRYVDRNPVEAQLVASPEGYRWSSFLAHGYGAGDRWLVDHPTYLELGATPSERRVSYRRLCDVI